MASAHDDEPQTSASAHQRPEYVYLCSLLLALCSLLPLFFVLTPVIHRRLRPRRLEPDTLSYLKEVAESLTQSGSDEMTPEEAEMMLWNVLEELAPRAASASSDRHGGEVIEAILPRMSDGQLRFFLSKMEGYFSHLWTNRYSSHVLQNVLARAGLIVDKELNDTEEAEDDERLQGTPAMSEIVVNMVSELEREWLTLMNDVSASHVWRSVLAVLAGRPLAPEKRGKKGKHRALGPSPTSASELSGVQLAVPASFEALYAQVVRTFRNAPTAAMLDYVYDRNAGPLLAMALRLAPGKLQSKLAQHLLQWGDEAASAQTFYDYAGEAVASHVLEAVFASVSDDFFAAILRRCMFGAPARVRAAPRSPTLSCSTRCSASRSASWRSRRLPSCKARRGRCCRRVARVSFGAWSRCAGGSRATSRRSSRASSTPSPSRKARSPSRRARSSCRRCWRSRSRPRATARATRRT
ncbi:hypothetical protein PINS_up011286 [Pythium insidiosum]|nr:hypothetical protein PINS_up011286 [Pythium insidiosum]